jgi:hypothetical protein
LGEIDFERRDWVPESGWPFGRRELEPFYERAHNDLAWDVLGRWNKVLADVNGLKRAVGSLLIGEMPTGSNAEEVLCFQKAIEINPNRLMHYIELGTNLRPDGKYRRRAPIDRERIGDAGQRER